MTIGIVGTGYVGLITGLCLAKTGQQVICADIDQEKIDRLQRGEPTIHEEGLPELLQETLHSQRVQFTTDLAATIRQCDVIFLCVPTPSNQQGATDLRFLEQAIDTIAQHATSAKTLVIKSTVPCGTHRAMLARLKQQTQQPHQLISNPEFLREGKAIYDCLHPERIVIGGENPESMALMRKLYDNFIRQGIPLLTMSAESAELAKYACNAYLATKISFMSALSQLCESTQADIEAIKQVMAQDARIGKDYLNVGSGYGGSCLPKDVDSLLQQTQSHDCDDSLLRSVKHINETQQVLLFNKINSLFENQWHDKTIALWGLAFKPGTDDIRSATSCKLMELIWRQGGSVRAFDPSAMPNIARQYANQPLLTLCDRQEDTLLDADILVIITEWDCFRQPNYALLYDRLNYRMIFDGRNCLDPIAVKQHGLAYYAIGRGEHNTVASRSHAPIS